MTYEGLGERRIDIACVQEIRWRGSPCRYFGATGKRYKLFWMGSEAKTEGVGIFVAEKWVDSVVSVERHSERIMALKSLYYFSFFSISNHVHEFCCHNPLQRRFLISSMTNREPFCMPLSNHL